MTALDADHYLEVQSVTGVLQFLLDGEDFINLSWSRSLNAVDTCNWTLPHTTPHGDLLEPYQRILLWRRSHSAGLWYLEWSGILLTIIRKQQTDIICTALSLDWFLQQRVVAWHQGTDRRTSWNDEPTQTVVSDLIATNLGSAATAAAGRWADGTLTTPPWSAVDADDPAEITHIIAGQPDVFTELTTIATQRNAAWQVLFVNDEAQLKWRVRPWGNDLTTGSDTLRLSLALDNLDTSSITHDRTQVSTRSFVVEAQIDAMQPTVNTVDLPDAQPITTETMTQLYSDDVDPQLQAQVQLSQGLSSALTFQILPAKLASLRYPDAYGVGDRIAVDLGTAEVFALDVEGVRCSVQPNKGETVQFDYQSPVGGRFAV